MIDVTFSVPEMSCGHCKAAVEGELNGLFGGGGLERGSREGHRRGAL